MKRKFKIFAGCALIIAMLIGALVLLGRLTERKESREKYYDFFQQEADFDVLFLGSSHMMNAVYPMELWNDYGIVSYNMAGHASTLGVSYWMLQNALDYTSPQMVVIDCHGMSNNYIIHEKFEYMHQSFDAFPLSLNKLKMINELVQDSKEGAGDRFSRRMELLWNFTTYHNRWSELEPNDYRINPSPEKGAVMRIGVAIPAETAVVSPEKKYEGNDIGKQHLVRLIEDCQQKGIKILLTYMPFPAGEKQIKEARAMYDIAEAYGVEYINFLDKEMVNFTTDLFDPDSHLNNSGAHKITDYIGTVLQEQFGIEDHRNDAEYAHWHDDWKEYYQFKLDQLIQQTSGYKYLMMLSDSDYSFVLELNRWNLDQDVRYVALLENLGIEYEHISKDVCYVVVDRTSDTVQYISREALENGTVETALGSFGLESDESSYYFVLDDDAVASVKLDKRGEYDFRVLLHDNDGNILTFSQLDVK